jgi:hypothetical protein
MREGEALELGEVLTLEAAAPHSPPPPRDQPSQ